MKNWRKGLKVVHGRMPTLSHTLPHAYTHTHTPSPLHMHINTHTFTHIHAHTHIHTHTHTHTYIHTHTHNDTPTHTHLYDVGDVRYVQSSGRYVRAHEHTRHTLPAQYNDMIIRQYDNMIR
jgi:pyridinium-3,5-bisthiocarboxylic acid mononucleotide nickel chelatase